MRILSVLLLTLVISIGSKAQIIAVDPAFDGGFEAGGTFAANGWVTVNSANNAWVLTNNAPPFAGALGAHISSSGSAYDYTTTVASTSHFYRDITIPSGSVGIVLRFQWKGQGQTGTDRLLVYTAPTSVTPAMNVPATPSTTITGAALVWSQPSLTGAYTSATVPLPSSLAGTTFRLIFTWQNDNTIGLNPPAAIDDISVTYGCGAPAAIVGQPEICIGAAELYTSATSSGTWSTADPLVVSVASSGFITGLSAGTATISYTTSCVSPATMVVTVHAAPTAITGSSNVCIGGTTTLANTATGGTWSSLNTSIASVGSLSGVVSGLSLGVDTIEYRNICGSAIKSITVNPLPPAIVSEDTVCEGGATVSLSNAFSGGTWSVSPSTTASATTTGPTTGVVTGIASGTATVTYTSAVGCITTKVLTISPLPPPITGMTPICAGGSSVSLSNSFPGGTWSTSVLGVATITPGGTLVGLAGGTTVVSYTNGCGPATLAVTVYAAPDSIVGSDTVCIGGVTTFADSVLGGTWSSAYPGVATVLSGSGVITGLSLGASIINYTMPGGCMMSKVVNVVDLPPAITGPTSVCPGGTITLANAESGGTWTSLNPGSASINPVTGVVSGIATDVAVIEYSTHAGCTVSTTITVDAVPAPIIGRSTFCVGDIDTLYDADFGGVWSSLTTSKATIGNTSGIITAVGAGTATIRYTLPTTCSITRVFTINPLPTPVVTFNGPTNTFSTGAGYASYQWYHSLFGEVVGATIFKTAGIYNGSYWVVVTDDVGCVGESSHIPYNTAMSVSNVGGNSVVKLVPNPASNYFSVLTDVDVDVVIAGMDGKSVIEQSGVTSIDISELPSGIYTVSIYSQDGMRIAVEKLIKE